MREIVTSFLILLLFSNCTVQKTIHNKENYPYTYSFKLDYKNDISACEIKTIKNQLNVNYISGRIIDYTKEGLGGVAISIVNTKTGISKGVVSDFDGFFKTEIEKGEYLLVIKYPIHKEVKTTFIITKDFDTYFDINLARINYNKTVIIHAKTALNEQDISNIKQCIEQNELNLDKCQNDNYYFIYPYDI